LPGVISLKWKNGESLPDKLSAVFFVAFQQGASHARLRISYDKRGIECGIDSA
jgi:hypothetical protein